jgi:hypothetical protein
MSREADGRLFWTKDICGNVGICFFINSGNLWCDIMLGYYTLGMCLWKKRKI